MHAADICLQVNNFKGHSARSSEVLTLAVLPCYLPSQDKRPSFKTDTPASLSVMGTPVRDHPVILFQILSHKSLSCPLLLDRPQLGYTNNVGENVLLLQSPEVESVEISVIL